MALVLNNFWGAETGGMEETSAFSGVSVSSSTVRSGAYSYNFSGSADLTLDPFESVVDAGGDYVVGIAIHIGIALENIRVSIRDSAATEILRLTLSTSNSTLRDSASNTDSGSGVTGSAWHFYEIWFEASGTGNCTVYQNGNVLITSSNATDFDTGNPVADLFIDNTGATPAYVDDIYFMSGATSADDRLGGCEIYSYRSSLNSASPDLGSTLNTGTWLAIQTVPFSGSVGATYDNVAVGGRVNTDDVGGSAGTGGPYTDANITGEIIASKQVARLERGNGGGTEHFLIFTNSEANAIHRFSYELGLSTSPANYFHMAAVQQYSGPNYPPGFNYVSQKTLSGHMFEWSRDGTKYYRAVAVTGTIYQHAASTAFDPTTINSTAEESLAFTTAVNTAYGDSPDVGGLAFTSDGDTLYVGTGNDGVTLYLYEFSLSTSWDISTATINGTTRLAIGANPGWMDVMRVRDNDTKLYIGGNGRNLDAGGFNDIDNTICQYNFSSPGIANLSFSQGVDLTSGSRQAAWAMSHDGTQVVGTFQNFEYWGTSSLDAFEVYTLSTPFDISTASLDGYWLAPSGDYTQLDYHADDCAIFFKLGSATQLFSGEGIVPSTSQYISLGMAMDGAQDIECYDMLGMVLHVPLTGGSLPPVSSKRVSQRAMLVR